MTPSEPVCLVCQARQNEVPLIQLIIYQNNVYHICPEHFPLLIHSPQKLAGKLPGAEKLHPHEQ